MQMADSGASKPRYTSRYWLFLARARLIVKSSLRSPDLENSPRENLICGEALLNSAQYIYGFGVDLTLKIIRGLDFVIFTL